jgi:hypothetical protein
MVVETLIFDTIDLVSKLEKLLLKAKNLSLIAKKKNYDHEGTRHFQDQWATKFP